MRDDRARTLLRRVEALSSAQRAALAEAVGSVGTAHAPDRLVGFVVTHDASSPPEGSLRRFLAARLPEYMIPARFVAVERLPRTAVGKLDRRALARSDAPALREASVAHDSDAPLQTPLEAAERAPLAAPLTAIEARLVAIWRDVLKMDDVGVDDDFFEIGGDSLLSIRVIARAGRDGIRVSPASFFERPTIRHMAATFAAAANGDATRPARTALPDAVGNAPLTPIQHWFLDAIPQHRDWWNQSYLLEVGHTLDSGKLREIVQVLIAHHDALRLRLAHREGHWHQEFAPADGDAPLRVVDVGAARGEQLQARVEAEGEREHASLRIEEGRLFRCVYFEGDGGWRRLLLLGHHLVLDGVSWHLILEDLATLVAQAAEGQALRLPERTAPARAWAIDLAERAATAGLAEMAAYWLTMPTRGAGDGDVRVALTGTNADTASITLVIDADESRSLLHEAPRRLEATVQALLLAALLLAWNRWGGAGALRLDVEGHGRDLPGSTLDVSRTVGWFTTVFPMLLTLPSPATDDAWPDAALVVAEVRRALEALPMRGAAHGLLRYLSPDEATRAALAAQPRPVVLFNHLGDHDLTLSPFSRLRVTDEPQGSARSPQGTRAYPLELNSRVERGMLIVAIEYSRRAHEAQDMERFAATLRRALEAVARAIPARFGLAGVDASTLTAVAGLLDDLDDD